MYSPTLQYDAIIIGNDLSSLIAADLSMGRGFKTLILKDNDIPVSYSQSGYTFNHYPLPFPCIGYDGFRIFTDFIQDLFPKEKDIFKPIDPGLQIILPKHRIDIYRDTNMLIRDFEREFPGHSACIVNLHQSLSKAGSAFLSLFLKNQNIQFNYIKKSISFLKSMIIYFWYNARFLAQLRYFHKDEIVKILEAIAFFSSGSHYRTGWYRLKTPFFISSPMRGFFYPLGGNHTIHSTILNRFLSQGGDISIASRITSVDFEGDKYRIAWDVESLEKKACSKFLLVSEKWNGLSLLHDTHFINIARFLRRRFVGSVYPFTVHMGILEKGIPEKHAEYAILIPDSGRFKRQDAIFIEVSSPGDTKRAPEGKRALTATIFLDEHPQSLSDDSLVAAASDIVQKIEQYMPFLSENIDFFDIEKCIALSRLKGDIIGNKYGITFLNRRLFLSYFKNLHMTGNEILGQSFIGEVISGINAANNLK